MAHCRRTYGGWDHDFHSRKMRAQVAVKLADDIPYLLHEYQVACSGYARALQQAGMTMKERARTPVNQQHIPVMLMQF